MKKLLISTCFLIAPFLTNAQPHIDIIKVEHMSSPDDGFFRQNEEGLDFIRSRVDLSLPIAVKQHYILFNPGWEYQQLRYNSGDPIFLNNMYFPISFLYKWKKDGWKTSISYIPRVIGDLREGGDLAQDYFQHGGAVLFYRDATSGIRWKFGAYVNDEFFGIWILPLFGMDWQINDKLSVYGVLPRRMFLNHTAGKNSNFGMAFKARTNSFRYLKSGKDDFFDIRENQLLLYGTTKVVGDLVLLAEVGHTIFRRSKFVRGDDNETFKDVNDGYIIRIGVAYRVKTD